VDVANEFEPAATAVKRRTHHSTLGQWARNSLQYIDDTCVEVENAVASSEGSSIATTVANLVKSISGSGLVVLSLAFLQGSIIPSALLLMFFALIFGATFYMVGMACDIARVYTFRELWIASFGKKTAWGPDLIVSLNGAMACLLYVVTIRDYLESAVAGFSSKEFFFVKQSWLMLVFLGVFVLFPLTLLRKLGPLQYTSIAGLVVTFYVFAFVLVSFFSKGSTGWENLNKELIHVDHGLFSVASYLSASYSAHVNAPKFYGELKNRSLPRFRMVVSWVSGVRLFSSCSSPLRAWATSGER
jgi:amino acid permease